MALDPGERPATAAEMRQMFRESDEYAYLAESVTFAAKAAAADVFAQPTRLMADSTRPGEVLLTDLKTELHSASSAHETSVASGTSSAVAPGSVLTSGPAPIRRGFAMAIGALLVLVVGGAIAGGLCINQASIFGSGNTTERSTVPPLPLANANSAVDTNIDPLRTGAETPAATNANSKMTTGNSLPPERAPETTKGGKAIEKPKTQTDEDDTFDVKGDPDNPEEVTIRQRDKNGKVTTMTLRPNDMPDMPNPPVPNFNPFPKGLEPGNLTPEQIRELIRLKPPRQRPGDAQIAKQKNGALCEPLRRNKI